MKRLTTYTTHLLAHEGRPYIVTLTRIHNDVNGNPRFEAVITNHDVMLSDGYANAYRYRFTGHYMAERQEAEWILARHMEGVSE